ncbi:hypothetical protein GALL_531990 [mine drainage metagenome]|uniref:Uncharacterized protein n=1 Tax=mine drainage metagenome TaxID=410659 RepID=A0A1J5P297_9ZZZZ
MEHIEIEARGDARGIVIGVIQYALVLLEIDADHHPRASSQDTTGAAQEGASLVRLEISKRRPRKKSNLGHRADGLGQFERGGEIRRDRVNPQSGEIRAQDVGLGGQEFAGNVHGNVGAECAFVQQQPCLGGGARAEFHKRRALGDNGGYRATAVAQYRELGAGRVVFRQQRDLLEQFRARGVVEIFWRQPFGVLRQIVDHVAGKCRGLFVEMMRFGQGGGMHVHDSLRKRAFRRGLNSKNLSRRSRRGEVR